MSFTVHGLPVSQGIAIGHAHLVSHALLEVNHYKIAPRHLEAELERFDNAVAAIDGELLGLKAAAAAVTAQPHSEVGAFIDLQRMMLEDPVLVEAARNKIKEHHYNAEWALVQQMELVVEQFRQIDDPYLRERKADVVQVVERLVKVLLGDPGPLPTKRKDGLGTVIVAHDLSPADTIGFKDHIAGFITDIGGTTSHTAIVARSLGIPAVVGLRHIRNLLRADELIIVDGTRGIAIIDPDKSVIEEYQLRRSALELERSKLKRLRDTPATALGGELVQLMGNISGPQDMAQVKEAKADGVGLFRTEFLFIDRDTLPDEDEQYEIYSAVIKAASGKPVTARTFDIGADKTLAGSAQNEANPALGLRAVRYSLAEPKMFLTQLRALLRASAHGKLQVMIPMLAHADEIELTLILIEKAKEELREEGIKFNEKMPVGGMVEVPAAALALGMFVRHLDFLSIGTNDLIQYTLAVDRGNESVVRLYDPLHPAVLRLIAGVVQAAQRADLPVSLCGEMAGNAAYTQLLLGMGLRSFSMHPARILEIKQQILRADLAEITPKVQRILKLDEPARIREAVEKLAG